MAIWVGFVRFIRTPQDAPVKNKWHICTNNGHYFALDVPVGFVDALVKDSLIRSFVYNHNMLTPGQVSQTLNVPSSTVRRWAARFADHLSPQPTAGRHRSYTVDDLNTFRKIRDLSGEGVLLDDIAKRLDVVESPPDQTMDLITTEGYTRMLDHAIDTIQSLQTTMVDQGQRLTQLESRMSKMDQVTIDRQDDQLKRLREYVNLPWYKKIFTKPPLD